MLFDDIAKANIQALKDHDKQARSILSVLYGKFKLESIEQGLGAKELPDGDCLRIIQKTIKELDEEKSGYEKANRPEKVEEIEQQKNVLSKFLPKMMTEEEIRAEIEKLEDKKIPNVMKHFKTNFNGLCDMGLVSKIAKEYN
ncbi:MAG: GatB/YqeY domain-containing protein [Anaeroplasmataceae bacterium]|nr:GatB/YqeY domain-containing protein [Anaeroplasmataceae bacterium]MDE7384941.1 GatB/YqeY domain-containing protein [Anaeroplasmataceae bacterium]